MRSVSRDRVQRLARELLDALLRGRSVTLLKDREVVRQAISHAHGDELKREEEREEIVRKKIATLRNAPPAGSRDWDVLFRRMMEEEYVRESVEG